jgi:tetratricopeptide (TPR) repeat protein
VLATATAIIVFAFAWTARVQASYWRDSETLWTRTLAVTRDNAFAHASLADLLMRRDGVHEAVAHSEEALRIRPNDADGENNLGLALLQLGDERGALAHLQRCLAIDPGHMNGEINLAWLLTTSGEDSLRDGARAVQLAEDVAHRAGHENAIALRTLAAAYAESGRFGEAIDTAERAMGSARAQGQQELIVDLTNAIANYREGRALRSR